MFLELLVLHTEITPCPLATPPVSAQSVIYPYNLEPQKGKNQSLGKPVSVPWYVPPLCLLLFIISIEECKSLGNKIGIKGLKLRENKECSERGRLVEMTLLCSSYCCLAFTEKFQGCEKPCHFPGSLYKVQRAKSSVLSSPLLRSHIRLFNPNCHKTYILVQTQLIGLDIFTIVKLIL